MNQLQFDLRHFYVAAPALLFHAILNAAGLQHCMQSIVTDLYAIPRQPVIQHIAVAAEAERIDRTVLHGHRKMDCNSIIYFG